MMNLLFMHDFAAGGAKAGGRRDRRIGGIEAGQP